MAKINLPQIVFWDETHGQVQIGFMEGYTASFKQNEDGVLDKDGAYAAGKETLNTEYTVEILLCVGVVKCELLLGDILRRLE